MLQKILKTKKTIALAAGIVLGVLAVCGAVFLLSAAQKEKTEQKVTAEIVGQTETKQIKTEKKEDNSEFVIPENYVSVVTIKINPEFRIYLDEQMHVLAVEPVNTDAEEMAADEDWADITLGDFMNRIIVTAYEQGYLKDGATVFAGIETKEESLLNTIIEKIKACVKETVNRIPIQVTVKIENDGTLWQEGKVKEDRKEVILPESKTKPAVTAAEVFEEKKEEPERKPDTKPEPGAGTEPDTEPEPGAGTEPDTEPEPEPGTEPDTEPDIKPEDSPAYHLVWQDEFGGNALNRDDWNVELHEPGWVNSELQEYVDSDENIYVKDGNLIIRPGKTEKDGDVSYTSGRINTQNKHNFKYGYFECRAKVPQGAGYLPAFWMMPADENLYGQWPKCGEIDIMEVMGQQTNKLYGTIHYGEPHAESQGTSILESGNFAEQYHVFGCEWEPGSIKWYVDGVLYHEEHDWYSTTKNVGTVAYPAPFDQPFYIILNVAVGGSWVGNIDDTTVFDERARLVVDYVRVYQKDGYDENVKKPEKDVVLRDPDENGNYIINGDFAETENLTDENNWKFMTANGGDAAAVIENNSIKITTADGGTVDYSIQLVQAGVPFKKGAVYEVSFEAKASENRRMNTAVKAPDRSYMTYLSEDTELTTDWKQYVYSFKMTEEDDANGRLEYNMGASGSRADIEIRKVSVKMTKDADPEAEEEKTVLANGSLVYNGEFQEGEGRLGYWEISDKNAVSVVNMNNVRELHAVVNHPAQTPLSVSQSGLAFSDGIDYELSFTARGNAALRVKAAGTEQDYTLTEQNQTYTLKIRNASYENKNLIFEMTGQGEIYLDSVKIVEDSLIKNGSFNAGLSGFEFYKYSDGLASIVVDSLNEDNAADITIHRTGNTDWYIQLKQNHIVLEKEQWYRLKFDVKSDLPRKMMYAIQRDGSADNNWIPYTGSNIIELAGNNQYETVCLEFKMAEETDFESILSFTLGAVDNTEIVQKHRICLDNISLEKIEEPAGLPSEPAGENILNALWTNVAPECGGNAVNEDGKYRFELGSSGTNNWDAQLTQQNLTFINGKNYQIKFTITSDADRAVKLGFRDPSNGYKGYYEDIILEAQKTRDYCVTAAWTEDTTNTGEFVLLLGTPEGGAVLGEHTVTIEKISAAEMP